MNETLAARISYFIEDAEARVEEALPMSSRVALAVARLEMIEKRLAAIEATLSLDLATVLTAEELAAMETQEQLLDWVRDTRTVARDCVARLMAGEAVDASAIEWPASPGL